MSDLAGYLRDFYQKAQEQNDERRLRDLKHTAQEGLQP